MKPVFLVHGFLGYRSFLLWKIFPGVVEHFQKEGIPTYQPLIHPTASIQTRSQELFKIIEQTLGTEEPYHMIGHSMGGIDARYLASPQGLDQGHRIMTITTLSSPHRGSCYAEIFPPFVLRMVSLISKALSYLPWEQESRRMFRLVGENNWAGLNQLQPDSMNNVFNKQIIDHPQVRYFSYAGCLEYMNSIFSSFPRAIPWRKVYRREGDNDSLVSVQSAQWGEFKGIVHADHGEIVGLRIFPWSQLKFDFISFLSGIMEELAKVERKD